MSFQLGFMLEGLVAVLLTITIGYCSVFERRLRAMRLNQGELVRTVADLGASAERAERAVRELRLAAAGCEATLAARLEEAGLLDSALAERLVAWEDFALAAERLNGELAEHVQTGERVLANISRIVSVDADIRRAA